MHSKKNGRDISKHDCLPTIDHDNSKMYKQFINYREELARTPVSFQK